MDGLGRRPTDHYLAGFLDGEGCFRFSKGSPIIEATGTYLPLLHCLELRFGGRCYAMPVVGLHRTVHRWYVTGPQAIQALEEIHYLLIEKRSQAELILQLRQTKPGPTRDSMIDALKKMKRFSYDNT